MFQCLSPIIEMLKDEKNIHFLLFFFGLQLVNVVLNTLKSIITVKGTTFQAALINTITFSVYTVVVVYTASDFPLLVKVAVTAVTNFIGVYISSALLNRFRKDKLWEITATIKDMHRTVTPSLEATLFANRIAYNKIRVYGNSFEYVYHIYTKNRKESKIVKEALKLSKAKYIVHEESVKL